MITMTHDDNDRSYTMKLNDHIIIIPYSMVETANPASLLWSELVNDMTYVGNGRRCEATQRNVIRFFNIQLAVERVRVRGRQPKTRQLMEGSVFV